MKCVTDIWHPLAEKMRKHEVDNGELNECVNSCLLLGLLLVQGGLDYRKGLQLTIMVGLQYPNLSYSKSGNFKR